MEPLDGPPVSSPDPAISDSVEQLASSSTHAVTDMPFGSSPVQTRTLHPKAQECETKTDPTARASQLRTAWS